MPTGAHDRLAFFLTIETDVPQAARYLLDAVRTMGKRYEGESLYAASILRNTSLIAMDLRIEEARDDPSCRRDRA